MHSYYGGGFGNRKKHLIITKVRYGKGYWNKCFNSDFSKFWYVCNAVHIIFRGNNVIGGTFVGSLLPKATR